MKIKSTNFNVDKDGNTTIFADDDNNSVFVVKTSNAVNPRTYIQAGGLGAVGTKGDIQIQAAREHFDTSDIIVSDEYGTTIITGNAVTSQTIRQTSKESKKKNISKYNEKALDIVKDSEIYEYNFKSENDKDKKHYGFVIGDECGEYKTPEEVISNDREGIESYSMTSILWKAFQEYIAEKDEQIEQLQKEIKELKKESE